MTNNQRRQIVLVKNEEKYIFRFDQASHKALLRAFGRYAASAELSFSWHDAAMLSKRVRHQTQPAGLQPGSGGKPVCPRGRIG